MSYNSQKGVTNTMTPPENQREILIDLSAKDPFPAQIAHNLPPHTPFY